LKIKSLNLVCTELDPERFPSSPMPEIAVSGRSNVGKSSLLNKLLAKKNIARVSKEPGKTRTINFFLLNDRFYLVDLPGYGYAKVSKEMRFGWQKVIFDYIEERKSLAGVVQLIDSRHPSMKDDLVMIERLIDADRKFLVVFTKSDKISGNERASALKEFRSCFDGFTIGKFGDSVREEKVFDIQVVFSSATTGEGRDEIWKWIVSVI